MRHLPIALLAALIACVSLTSCFGDDEEYEPDRNCYVSAATMGTLKRYVHLTASDGSDSIATVNVTGSLYRLSIDQQTNRIFNPDSLPKGTDLSRIVFTVFTATGTTAIKSLQTDEDSVFVGSDSTDFRQPRHITVYGYDGVQRRTYEVCITAHQEDGDTLQWQLHSTSDATLAGLTDMRAMFRNGVRHIFARKDGQRVLLATDAEGNTTTTPIAATIDTRNVLLFAGTFYAANEAGEVMASDNGADWQTVSTSPHINAIVATASDRLFAIGDDGIYSSSNGADWTPNATDTPNALPTTNFAAASKTANTDGTMEEVMLTGQRDGSTVVWKLNIDHNGMEHFNWMLVPQTEENTYPMPVLDSPNVLSYDNGALLIGTDPETGLLHEPLFSNDFGRTWKPGHIPALSQAAAPGSMAVAVDDGQYIWVICAGSGEVWRGRINRLGWENPPTSFLKARRK